MAQSISLCYKVTVDLQFAVMDNEGLLSFVFSQLVLYILLHAPDQLFNHESLTWINFRLRFLLRIFFLNLSIARYYFCLFYNLRLCSCFRFFHLLLILNFFKFDFFLETKFYFLNIEYLAVRLLCDSIN